MMDTALMMKWLLIAFTVFVSSAGDILCAGGMSKGGEVEVHGTRGVGHTLRYIVTRKLVIMGWLCYAAAFFSLVALLSVTKMTVAIPATALSFVIDTIGARFILHEHVPWRRWIGVLCVTVGVVLAVRTVGNGSPPRLAGATGGNRVAMHAHKDQPGYHQRGADQLDEQRAPREVLAKP